MNNLKIREMNIDWLEIINLAFNKKHWGEIYTLYTNKKATITCKMKEFNFEEECAWFKIIIRFNHNNILGKKETSIRYLLKNFTIDDFKMHLNKTLFSALQNIIDTENEAIAENFFKKYKYHSYNLKEKDILKSSYWTDYKLIKKIESESLQDSCLNELKYNLTSYLNQPYKKMMEEYCDNNPLYIEGITELIEKFND